MAAAKVRGKSLQTAFAGRESAKAAGQPDARTQFELGSLTKTLVGSWQPARPRDTAFEYSNLGYGLLGYALAREAGQALDVLLRDQVLAPLGLQGMVLARPGTPAGRLATGHDAQGQAVPPWHFDVLAGAVALRATLAETVHYAQAALGVVDLGCRENVRVATNQFLAQATGDLIEVVPTILAGDLAA